MFANVLRVKVFETSEALAVKENQYRDDLCIGKTPRLIAMYFAITDLMIFEL